MCLAGSIIACLAAVFGKTKTAEDYAFVNFGRLFCYTLFSFLYPRLEDMRVGYTDDGDDDDDAVTGQHFGSSSCRTESRAQVFDGAIKYSNYEHNSDDIVYKR